MDGASKHLKIPAPYNTHPTGLDHTAVWNKQGSTTKAKPLNYYPTVEEIFTKLERQTKTDIPNQKFQNKINNLL